MEILDNKKMGQLSIELLTSHKDLWIMLTMASAIAFLFRQYIKKEERLNKNAENYMARMEKASGKYEGLTEKMLEYQANDTKAKLELAVAMTKQAEATQALGGIVDKGLNDLAGKIEDSREQIIAHIDINEKKKTKG